MKKTWLVVIGAVLILGVVGLVGCSGGVNGTLELKGNLNSQQEGIWVNGEGKVTAVPDVAILSLGIESQEATVAEAQDKANVAMD
ncbi:MAG TPA: SIMPL domain-containing protein, partial [Dehalococcoidales bacterium]|nr:SIMPL domain-containing protein [Dehalococcoidales bacterium]